jgi:hypothetical protein
MYKKVYTSIVSILVCFVFILLLSTCKKDDTTLPVIKLLGDSTITLNLGDTLIDPGATANDNKDGNITGKIVVSGLDSVNTNEAGEFIIGYHVQDAAGNIAIEATRKVHVKTDYLTGTYNVFEYDTVRRTDTTYSINVVQSPKVYNQLIIFNLRGITDTVKALVSHKYISFPFQIINVNNITDTISGDGGTYNGSPFTAHKFSLLTLRYSLQHIGGYNHYFISTLTKTSKKSDASTYIILPKK